MSRSNLPGLTNIRFFAALWVIFFHIGFLWHNSSSVFADLISIGYIAVSIFFILSGFILGYNYAGTNVSAAEFWAARAGRILPVYFVGLLLDAHASILSVSHAGQTGSYLSLLPAPFLLQAWFPFTALSWNPPAWSLSCEAFFYLLFPFLAPKLATLFRRCPLATLSILWLLSAVPSVAYAFLHPEGIVSIESRTLWLSVIRFNPLLRLPEFALGICLGAAYLDGLRIPRPRLCLAGSCLGLVLTAVFLRSFPYPALHNGLLSPLFVVMILSAASLGSAAHNSILQLLGEASYSLYILMVPLGTIVSNVARRLHFNLTTILGVAVYIVIAVGISILSLKWVETPARRWIRARLSSSQRKTSAKNTETISA